MKKIMSDSLKIIKESLESQHGKGVKNLWPAMETSLAAQRMHTRWMLPSGEIVTLPEGWRPLPEPTNQPKPTPEFIDGVEVAE